jgi:hypothetical protein
MQRVISISLLIGIPHLLLGGESSLTTTYQPLDGLRSGAIIITQVACHDWYSHSGQPTAISLISAPNVPPTNNPKEATENLNLASACGFRFGCGDIDATRELTFDATDFEIPKRFDHPREQIVRACLECLRRCLPEKLLNTPVMLKASESEKEWLSKIVSEFNTHDRRKVFFIPPS